jgi:hypothetical protein
MRLCSGWGRGFASKSVRANNRDPEEVAMGFESREPWWSEMLKRHGIPALFAIILLLAILGIVPSDISTTCHLVQRHTDRDQEELVLLRLICQHTSKDRAEMDACTQAPRRQIAGD